MLKRKSKRVLSIVLAVAMIAGLFPIAAFADGGELPAPNDDGVIKLTEDVTLTAPFTVAQNKNVTIDLNGHKITNASGQHTIVNNGTLIINDSSENHTGVVDNVSHGKAAIYNNPSGNVTLNGGTYDRSHEAGSDADTNGGNSFYTLKNFGTMTINVGVTVQQDGTQNSGTTGKHSSLIANGWQNIGTAGEPGKEPAKIGNGASLTVNGGTFKGGLNTIKNDDCGTAVINNGDFSNFTQAVVQNHNVLTINDGKFTAGETTNDTYAVDNCGCAADNDIGTLTIAGGNFSGSTYGVYDRSTQPAKVTISGGDFSAKNEAVKKTTSSNAQVAISGGTFSSDVSTYVPNGYICKQDAENGNWTVSGISSGQMVVKPESSAAGNVEATLDGVYNDASTDIKDEVNSGESNEDSSNIDANGVVVNIAKNDATATTSATLNVTKAAADSLASAPALTVKTNVGDVQLDAQALDKVAQAKNDVTITIEKKNSTDSFAKALYTVEVKSDDENLLPESAANNGTVTITVAKPDRVENPQAWYVVGEGSSLVYVERLAATETDGRIAITINHLSSVALTDGNPENQEVATVVDADGNLTHHATLQDAVTAAKNGGTITLVKNVEIADQISLPANATLDGAGHTLTYTGTTENISGGAFNITNDNVTINDLTINAAGLKHGVQFYCTKGGELNGVTINGGVYTSVIVNGATNVDIIDCVLNPVDGAYTNIEYAMGGKVTTIPSMNINNVTFDSSKPAVWADKDTTTRVDNAMTGDQTNEAILAEILDNITYTSPNGGSLAIAVGFSDNSTLVGYEESTYQPPYTGKYSYEIFTTVGDNGAIDVDRYATEGDKVTITISPDEAYMLDEMTITSGGKDVEVTDNGDGTYTFTMPSGDVKIEVTFAEDPDWEPAPEMPFTDVNEGDWFYDVVLYAYDNGLMTGTSADTFAPNTATTRGMIVSMLARLEGVTSAEDAGFADVAANDWYATAVNWAASVGVVNGYEDNTFRPNAPITREQMAAILYNYADYKGYDVSARADLSDYADAASISSWAEDVLAWANAEGLINGMTATTIDPQGATTRAQTAAMFERFLTAHEA